MSILNLCFGASLSSVKFPAIIPADVTSAPILFLLFLGLLPQTVSQTGSDFSFLSLCAASGWLLLTDFLLTCPTALVFHVVIISMFLTY